MRKKGLKSAALLCLTFLLTACGSKEYDSAEDYIQLKAGVTAEAEEDTPGTGMTQDGGDTGDATDHDTADAGLSQVSGSDGCLVDSMPGGKAEIWADVMEYYRDSLSRMEDDEDYLQDTFMVADLNSDGVPELLHRYMEKNSYRESGGFLNFQVLTYWGSLVKVFDYDNTLHEDDTCTYSLWYYPGTGVFAKESEYRSAEEDYYYMSDLSGQEDGMALIPSPLGAVDKEESIAEWHTFPISEAESMEAEEDITPERFYTLLKKLTGDTEAVYLPDMDEWYDNTEENREAYLK